MRLHRGDYILLALGLLGIGTILRLYEESETTTPKAPENLVVEETVPEPFVFSADPQPTSLFSASIGEMDDLTITGHGEELVRIDMRTGQVTLSGDPNEAARVFWEAVAHARPCVP